MDYFETLSGDIEEIIGTDLIKNQIAEALAQRIEIAVRAKKRYEDPAYKQRDETMDDGTFRVILVIPNFPEGAVTDVSVQVRF